MRTIAHLSDLHFGRADPVVVEGLLADLALLRPSLIVISGDLVQRAGPRHFAAARAFLERLEQPYLVVPGKYDSQALLKAIVGVEISITSMEGKWKLGQNRPAGDGEGIRQGLIAEGRPDLAELIKF